MRRLFGCSLRGGVCALPIASASTATGTGPFTRVPAAGASSPVVHAPFRSFGGAAHPTRPSLAPKSTHPYQCSECGKAFRLLNALNHHILTKHSGKATAMVADEEGHLSKVGSVSGEPPRPITPSSSSGTAVPSTGLADPSATTTSPSSTETVAAPGPSPTAVRDEPSDATDAGATEEKEQVFVCTICQKTFRLEAALQHHYQAKHNTQMPTAGGGSGTSAAASTPANPLGLTSTRGAVPGGASPFPAADADGPAPLSASEFVRQQESVLPDAPAYHLEVAPNAPEEGDLAVHWRCVNSCVLVGTVTELTEGYVFEDHVLQLTVATHFEAPSPGDPDKDFHTVRVYGEDYWKPLVASLKVGDDVVVNGRLRMVPQFDAALKRYYHYPLVQVSAGTGLLTRLAP